MSDETDQPLTVTREIIGKLHNRRVRLATLSDGSLGIRWVRLVRGKRKSIGVRLSREAAKMTAVGILKMLHPDPFSPVVSPSLKRDGTLAEHAGNKS